MSLLLLDADAVIDHLSGYASSVRFIDSLVSQQNILGTCAVVVAEVFSGVGERELIAAEKFISSCIFLTTPIDAAVVAGQWRYRYAREGIRVATADALIAATAQVHGATLVTGNVRHFPMPEVSLIPLPRP